MPIVHRYKFVMLAFWLAAPLLAPAGSDASASKPDHRGNWFLGLTNVAAFQTVTTGTTNTCILLSPVLPIPIAWTELVGCWNAELTPGQWLELEAAPQDGTRSIRFHSFGTWSLAAPEPARTSIRSPSDAFAAMETDTLVLKQPARSVQLRLTLGGGATTNQIKFLGLSFHGPSTGPTALPPNRAAWGRVLDVPERSQMDYENGNQICSPTTVSMLLSYWATRLARPELDVKVPAVCEAVYDPGWRGWGNWAFNMAYAGAQPGLRAYATRLSDLSELEAWIEAGIPVGLSLCYNKLRGTSEEPSGHLVVCVGFTPEGEVIVNDGGTRHNIRKTFSRDAVRRAWANSKNTVYLVYPADFPLPKDRMEHWER